MKYEICGKPSFFSVLHRDGLRLSASSGWYDVFRHATRMLAASEDIMREINDLEPPRETEFMGDFNIHEASCNSFRRSPSREDYPVHDEEPNQTKLYTQFICE